MSLFNGIPPNDGLETVVKATERLRERLAKLHGTGPYSLCESGAQESDYRWLRQWAEHLSYDTVELTGWMAGALTLLLVAEAARREAQEGHVWPVMQHPQRFRGKTQRRFFDGGQPSTELKTLLTEAIEKLKLRHVLDRESVQPYYRSIYLQFGFTQIGMASQLPVWLAGRPTEAILHLRDPDKGSKSFRQLWSALRNYRRDFLTKEQVRDVIRTSPWVLPSLEEELLRLARENLDLGTESDLPAGATESEECPFLLPPRLRWEPPEDPAFSCELTNLDSLGLTADHYCLRMGSSVLATLFRQPDNNYIPDRKEVSLPCTLPQAVVSVVDPDGRTIATQSVDLWDVQEDVNVFDRTTGRRIDTKGHGHLNPRHSYVLLTASDLLIHPHQPVWLRLGGPEGRLLTQLASDWPEDLKVRTTDGSALWNPQLPQNASSRQLPTWAERVCVRWLSGNAQITVGQTLRLVVDGLFPRVSLSYVRLGGQPLDFDPVLGTLGEVSVTPELAQAGLHFLVGLTRDGEQAQIRSTLPVTVLGAAQCTERGWEPLRHDRTLTVREAGENVYRLFLPADLGEQRVALMEGSLYSSSAGKRPRPLGRLAGIGAPLVVRRAPYNCPDDLCQLADAVVDHGIVQFVEPPGEDGAFQIRLTRPIRAGDGHRVVCWSIGQGVELLGPERIDALDESRSWRFPCAARECANRTVVAIAYQGSWRGSGWACGLDQILLDIGQNTISPRQTAALIRWCHLPLLCTTGPGQPSVFESFVRAHASEVLAVWLFDLGLDEYGLVFDETAEISRAAWAALRSLFDGWQPSLDQIEAIIGLFAQVNPAQPLRALTYRLLPLDPLLAGKLILAWLKVTDPHSSCRTTAADYARLLLRAAAGLSDRASEQEVRHRQLDALEQAAQTMCVDSRSGVDPNFVKEGIADPGVNALQNGAIKRVQAVNLAVALQVGSFRHYLGLRVLEKVASLL